MASIFIATLLGVAAVQAFPALVSRQSITALSISQIDSFTPFTHFAGAVYCGASATLAWDCGGKLPHSNLRPETDARPWVVHCTSNPDFEPVASGGDGDAVQYCEIRI